MPPAILGAAGAAAAGGLAWSLWEAQWVELRERDVRLPGLPPELDGFRLLHLSDFHLGTLSLNGRSLEQATEWAGEREVDLVAITGDLVSRPRGRAALERALARLRARWGVFAVLGNHDVAATRDPFSRPAELGRLDGASARLLEHEAAELEVNGRLVQIAGADPRRRGLGLATLADRDADLRILLTHFPDDADRVPPDAFHLVLAGHLHGGQICVPAPGGKLRLSHLRAAYWEGLFERPGGALHVSRGLGTTFVPFRLLARPEATILTLRTRE
ncbi:MAG TPA: metallophosphoesterase [Gaiellaceae bacterium]|nr:metallophosphoesterase [Gaiellaceae bacterium]